MENTNRQMTKIAREAEKLVIRTMKDTGVGAGELDLLHLVRHQPGITQKEICQALQMDKGAAARRVRRLEEKGLLCRRPDPDDGRSQRLYATPRAEELKHSRTAIETAFYDWLLEGLEAEQRSALLERLDQLGRRAKAESRAGFPHVLARLAQEKESET